LAARLQSLLDSDPALAVSKARALPSDGDTQGGACHERGML
jgi:hypothetical protein